MPILPAAILALVRVSSRIEKSATTLACDPSTNVHAILRPSQLVYNHFSLAQGRITKKKLEHTNFSGNMKQPLKITGLFQSRVTRKTARQIATQRGRIQRIVSSNNKVKSKLDPHPLTTGPKVSSTWRRQLGGGILRKSDFLIRSETNRTINPLQKSRDSHRSNRMVCR